MSVSAVELGPVLPGDVEYVAEHIREADRVEVYEGTRREVLPALQHSVEKSDRTGVVRIDGKAAAVYGVGKLSLLSGTGVPWMLGTDMLRANAKVLLPMAYLIVRKMMQGHDVLRNIVHEDNKASIRWLRSMGFRMGEPVAVGWRGGLFRVFELTKEEI